MGETKLEPAERNFKKNLSTLVVILVIAFVAGGVILYNYAQMRKRQNLVESKGRAAEIGVLTKNFSYKNKENKNASFFDCTGHVTFVACFSANQLKDSKVVIRALKAFEEEYKNEPRVRFLLLSMDNEKDMPAEKVVPILEKAKLLGERWNVAMSNGGPFLAYIKRELKFIHLSKNRPDGEWIVPQRIRVLGPDLKVRGREDEYNFGRYQRDTEEARKDPKLLNNPDFQKDPRFMGDPNKIDLVKHAIERMKVSINYMLTNEEFDKSKIDTSKKKNIYKPYLWVFGGFALFLAVLWLKMKRSRLLAQDKGKKGSKGKK